MAERARKGWRRVKFGEIAENINERVDDPKKAGASVYVGLEHLDADSLKIRRWGSPDDVEATKLRFYKGDIIFGRRRAYQRKLGVAASDGICSAHAMVLRAKPAVVVPEFLPFFMQSDAFMERAKEISVGSLSPTINWTTLRDQEFDLPPREEQAQGALTMAEFDRAIECLGEAVNRGELMLDSLVNSEFSEVSDSVPLERICRPIVRGIDSPGPNDPNGTPYVRVSELTGPGGIELGRLLKTKQQIAQQHPESCLLEDDLVVALRGVVGLAVRVPREAAGANLSRGTARVSVIGGNRSDYVYWAFRSPVVRSRVARVVTGWKGEDLREITLAELRALRIPYVPLADQDRVVARIDAAAFAVEKLRSRLSELKTLKRRAASRCWEC